MNIVFAMDSKKKPREKTMHIERKNYAYREKKLCI